MRVFIWGTGIIATDYLKKEEIKNHELIGFIQTKKSKDLFEGKKVFEPEEIKNYNYDYILVCVRFYAKEIYDLCIRHRIPHEKLNFIDNNKWFDDSSMNEMPKYGKYTTRVNEKQDDSLVRKLFPQLAESIEEKEKEVSRYTLVMRNGYDLVDKNNLLQNEEFSSKEYQIDYFRYRTFEMMADEILNKNIKGDVTEVGVFKGVFAKMINAKFKDRKFYLFDTFESFDKTEFEDEVSKGRCPDGFRSGFVNTSAEFVLNKMLCQKQCIVRKGLFPKTAEGLESVQYAFVSIDVDFEKSILEGLRYFYPRLSKGGVIFVHDYNNRFLEGVKVAVKTFEEELGDDLIKVPIADEGGTLVIVKA